MITLTLPIWVWLLYCGSLGMLGHLGWLAGQRLGRYLYLRRQRQLTEWSRRG